MQKVQYVDSRTLSLALDQLRGSAGHLLKIWLTIKRMGFSTQNSIFLDTSNSTEALNDLFSCGAPDGTLFVPFAATPRFMEMKADASRSIIQTNANRWAESGSVVTCDPIAFLNFQVQGDSRVEVKATRQYPIGLGHGANGFANKDGESLKIPFMAFAVWYSRFLPQDSDDENDLEQSLTKKLIDDLHLDPSEIDLVFDRTKVLELTSQNDPVGMPELYAQTRKALDGNEIKSLQINEESKFDYTRRAQRMVGDTSKPSWLRGGGEALLDEAFGSNAKSVLLYGAPRTGKTFAIDKRFPRDSENRATIQVHDGWGYQELIIGYKPDETGHWRWAEGPLLQAIKTGKSVIVLEEINRTLISQALGELFSLLETAYRGPSNAITLPDGSKLSVPAETLFIFTMNNLDKSTEELDDALLGRLHAIEFEPSPSSLVEMLVAKKVNEVVIEKIADLHNAILRFYPLGHGYFTDLDSKSDSKHVRFVYMTRIRPVLEISLGEFKREELAQIDNEVDIRFGS